MPIYPSRATEGDLQCCVVYIIINIAVQFATPPIASKQYVPIYSYRKQGLGFASKKEKISEEITPESM